MDISILGTNTNGPFDFMQINTNEDILPFKIDFFLTLSMSLQV